MRLGVRPAVGPHGADEEGPCQPSAVRTVCYPRFAFSLCVGASICPMRGISWRPVRFFGLRWPRCLQSLSQCRWRGWDLRDRREKGGLPKCGGARPVESDPLERRAGFRRAQCLRRRLRPTGERGVLILWRSARRGALTGRVERWRYGSHASPAKGDTMKRARRKGAGPTRRGVILTSAWVRPPVGLHVEDVAEAPAPSVVLRTRDIHASLSSSFRKLRLGRSKTRETDS